MSNHWTSLVLFVLLAAWGLQVHAADTIPGESEEEVTDYNQLDLEDLLDVVVSATKTTMSAEEAPAIVTVIHARQIREWGYNSLAQALRHVTGFYLVDDHITPNVSVRGVSGGLRSQSGIIKVMIDGHPVPMRLTGGHWLGPELVPLSAVSRIEIIRGPASALYGADAFLGVINIITRNGSELAGLDTRMETGFTGSNLGGGEDMAFGFRTGDFEMLVAGKLLHQDRSGLRLPGSSPAPQVPAFQGDNLESSGLTRTSGVGLAKLAYHLGEKSRITATGYLSLLDRGAEFADWTQLAYGVDDQGRFGENRVSLAQGFADIGAVIGLGESIELQLDGMYFSGAPTGRDRIELGSDIYYVRRDFRYQGGEISLGVSWQVLPSLSVVGGAGIIYDEERLPSSLHVLKTTVGSLKAGDVRESTSVRQGIKAFLNPGGYIQVAWIPIEKLLHITGGLRYDHHNIYGSQLSGRLAAVVHPLENMHVKLLYGNAFKAPSPLLLYGVPLRSGDIIGNPDLDPQRVHTTEAQLAWTPWEFLTVRTDLSYSYLLNKAEFTLQGVNKVARNVAEVGSLSWETEVEAHYEDHLRGYLNVAVQHTVRDLGQRGYLTDLVGSDNPIHPPVVVNLGASGRLPWAPVRLTLEASWVAPRSSSDDNSLEAGKVYDLDAYLMLDASLSVVDLELLGKDKRTTLMLSASNLLGETGPDPGFAGIDLPLPQRVIMLRWYQEM